MKRLILLCGPNGIGKSTAARALYEQMAGSALVDADQCRMIACAGFPEAVIETQRRNLTDLICNYLACPVVGDVILVYGLHGHRARVLEEVLQQVRRRVEPFCYCPIVMTCSREENLRRARGDGRDEERVQRGVAASRPPYEGLDWPCLDVTDLSVAQTVQGLCEILTKTENCS